MAAKRPNRRVGTHELPKRREWGENKLGPASIEKPEKMRWLTYVLPTTGPKLPEKIVERHRQIIAIGKKVRKLLRARESDSVSFFRGASGAFYVELRNRGGTGSVFFKITNQKILDGIKRVYI